ncbi:aminotransferase [Lentzea guizhouensis]|uniref:Aminotransferase n=1 Tax=Lentzea guizhouensis TaxID=1586287 RepID=A0A1B2HQY9_9PSEU|nr:aminotransferase class I/II-fold pyridoxal phosphate-dependent enzyme [Lentzea guizhouensis]ANZ40102.1 aminotransferase [Lentzea guizhouensis]
MIPHSATLAVNEKINARRAAGRPVLHLGFGEAGLPVLPAVADALTAAAAENGYGPVAGSQRAREAAAGYLTRRDLPTDPGQIVFAPGSKPLLYAVLTALPGDVVLPVPSWVSYAAQAQLAGKRVIGVPVPVQSGGVPDPDLLEPALREARASGADPRVLVVTLPDNPTGTCGSADLVHRVCELADRHGLTILSDEIYRDLTFDPARHVSPARFLPERTVVTGGPSKSMALGGWRIGFARIADAGLRQDVTGIAGAVWSSLAAPMQAAAAHVLDEPQEVRDHLGASRRLHAAVLRATHEIFTAAGARCRAPEAGFYLYPDLEPLGLAEKTGVELSGRLLDEHDIGVLAGEHFGDDPAALRFRVATSLLYGSTVDERWEALRSADPVRLPWIAASLDQLRTALAAL